MKRHQPARSENPSPEFHPEFVDALRVLFDILDTSRTGRVSYETLCSRFCELPKPHLPPTFLNCVGKVAPANGLISFERFLTAVKLSFRERAEINNNTLHRVQSEGKLNQNIDKRRMQAPAMGVNGFDRRSQIYASQPALNEERKNHQYISQLNVAPIYASLATTNGSSNTNVNNYGDLHYDGLPQVVMRPRKVNTVRSQKEESRMRHPLPPSGVYGAAPRVAVARSRPHSTASYNSLASSGLENIAWRNSSLSTSTADSQRRNTMCEEDSTPRVAKLEGIHKEEADLVRRGLETTNKLSDWYKEKLTSLDKRSRLLNQRLVALDPAVHEQKLNFLRAHVTELNRRMVALMETSERGFPTHVNLQKNNLPQPQDDQLLWLYRQNEMLNQELGDKVRMLDDLRREKENGDRLAVTRIQPSRPVPIHHRPSAFVRPAFQSQPMHHVAASPIKTYDTLM